LSIGDQIVSINGLSTDSLGTVFLQGFSGERTSFRQQLVARYLLMLLWFHHIDPPYDLVVRQHNSQNTIARRVVGVADKDILRTDSLLARQSATPPPFRFERLEDSIMYIDFRSMEKQAKFKEFLLSTFEDIQRKPIKGLIIDLRNNGGGNSELGIMLLSFLTDSSYRMAERKEWRMSVQYKSFLRDFIPWWIRWFPITWVSSDARKYFGARDGEIIVDTFAVECPDTNSLRYRGKTCFLIGPRTFSSAMMLANAVADFKLATLIGEETGGIPTAFGEIYPFDLPNTKLLAAVSSAFFVRANGNREDRRGIVPAIEVRQTEEDTRGGKDTVLERARRWVLKE
jgi:C-terminal processing protease CtpA/Prc